MVIKEKLMFSHDYSFINKSCYSCKQFNHTVEDCPKLHFVPNIEKIIKQYTFPSINERFFYSRKNKKWNALLIHSNCRKAQKKFNRMILKKKSILPDESESSLDSKEKIVEIPDEDEFEETREEIPKKREDFLLHQYKTSKTDSKTSKEDNSETPRIFSEPKLPHSQKAMELPPLNNISFVQKKNSSAVGITDVEIDRVFDYKIYFPLFNIDNIIMRYNKNLILEREINKRYLKKYQNLKKYSFFQNIILEKFWKETKIKRKKRKKLGSKTPSGQKGSLKKKTSSFLIMRHTLNPKSPLTKKSFFGIDNPKTQITSFTNLIQTLITQKQQTKKSQK